MLGNYLGTISLCGMVAEMLAILLFEIAELEYHGKKMTRTDERGLFGNSFERLGRDRRVSILYANRLIDKELKDSFDAIRSNRRQYLHFWSKDYRQLPKDAVSCYRDVLKITCICPRPGNRRWKTVVERQTEQVSPKKGSACLIPIARTSQHTPSTLNRLPPTRSFPGTQAARGALPRNCPPSAPMGQIELIA